MLKCAHCFKVLVSLLSVVNISSIPGEEESWAETMGGEEEHLAVERVLGLKRDAR